MNYEDDFFTQTLIDDDIEDADSNIEDQVDDWLAAEAEKDRIRREIQKPFSFAENNELLEENIDSENPFFTGGE